MSKKLAVILSVVGCSLLCFIMFFGVGISTYNSEVSLRNQHEAIQKNNQVLFSKFVSIVTEKAGVVVANKEAQKELFNVIMSSKTGNTGGVLAQFIQQHNPNPDQALVETSKQFADLSSSIEGLRNEFASGQTIALQVEKDHNDLLKGFVSSKVLTLFGGNKTPLKTQLVVTSDTSEAFSTGVDTGLNLNLK